MKEHQIFFGIQGESHELKVIITDIRCTRSACISVDNEGDYRVILNIRNCKLNPVSYFENSNQISIVLEFYLRFLFGGSSNCDFWCYNERQGELLNSLLTNKLSFNYVSVLAKEMGAPSEHVENAIDAMNRLSQTIKGFGRLNDLPKSKKCSDLTMLLSASVCILRFAKTSATVSFKAAMEATNDRS